MDEHRKTAIEVRAKIAKAVFEDKVSSRDIDEVEYKIIEDAIRTTASKSEKDGWNKAINEAAHYACDAVHHVSCKPLSMEKKGHYIAKHIRRLIREEGK
jgi:hypothetical protein